MPEEEYLTNPLIHNLCELAVDTSWSLRAHG